MVELRAALYLRQSVDPTGLGAAVDRQRQDCVALAAARGWRVVAEYVDNDVSATARRRPGFQRLQDAAEAGEFDVIVAWHVDRLVRRLADLEPVLATCQSLRIQIATVTGELDPSTDAGRLVARILSSVAQAEVERKAARQARANRQRAEAGTVRLVRRPFGYDLGGRIQRREANAIRRAAEQVLDGASFAQAARDLNARGIPTSTGHAWRASSLTKVLRNPRYAGIATYHGDPVAAGRWTPILDRETHDALMARIQALAPTVNPGPRPRHLLSGLATCGICGAGLVVNVDGRTGRRTYRCPRLHLSRRLDLVDDLVVSRTLDRLEREDHRGAPATNGAASGTAERRRLLMAEAAMRNGTTLWISGEIDQLQWAHASRQLRAAIRAAEQTPTEVGGRLMAAAGRAARSAHPRRSLRSFWDHLSAEERRIVVHSMVTEIRVLPAGRGHRFDPAQVQIEWREDRLPARNP